MALINFVHLQSTAQTFQSSNVPISLQGYKLKGSTYKSLRAVSAITCSQRCLSEFPKCLSYNHLSTMGEYVCELNSKGISSMAEGLAGKLDKEQNSVFVQLQSSSMVCDIFNIYTYILDYYNKEPQRR